MTGVNIEISLNDGGLTGGVTSIDLNQIDLPTGVTPAAVTVTPGATLTNWSIVDGESLVTGDLDIAIVRGNSVTAFPASAATVIATLAFDLPATNIPPATTGTKATLTDFGGTATLGTVTALSGSGFVNETVAALAADVTSDIVANISDVYAGDVTGNGDITAGDAQETLVSVSVGGDLSLPSGITTTTFTAQTLIPAWPDASLSGRLKAAIDTDSSGVIDASDTKRIATKPIAQLNQHSAFAVADVDEDGFIDGNGVNAGGITGITSLDAAYMLQFAVGIIGAFPTGTALDPAPSLIAANPGEMFRVASTSARPGAQMTVSLDLADVRDLLAGELRFDYDTAALRPVDVRIESSSTTPLIAHSTKSGDLGIAWASATPIENGVLQVVFEAAPGTSGIVPARVRGKRLVLNRTIVETDFEHRFAIEPYRFQLMANYPNPFNPETWIPFELAADADVTIRIYGVDGSRVRTLELGRQGQGVYTSRDQAAYWDGVNDQGERVSSGVYMCEITAGADRAMRRMVIMK